jgi:hypothetical protein
MLQPYAASWVLSEWSKGFGETTVRHSTVNRELQVRTLPMEPFSVWFTLKLTRSCICRHLRRD